MNPFETNSPSADWLYFLAILLTIGIGLACFIVWMFYFRKNGKRKRKHRGRHHRHINPTLAEAGGLPPLRKPGEPPKGV